MFKYEELTEEQKKLIELLGDHTKTRILDAYSGTKSMKLIHESYYSKRMTYDDFIHLTELLYYDGLISYVPASINFVDNLSKTAKEQFKNNFGLEESWRNQNDLIRLTHQGERTITGSDIYLQLIKEGISIHYKSIDEILKKTDNIKNDYQVIKDKIDNGMIKNIEILSIFIAIVALIGGNISVFNNYSFSNLYELVILLLITNAILLFVFMALLIMVKRIIMLDTTSVIKDDFRTIMFPIVLVIIALIVAA